MSTTREVDLVADPIVPTLTRLTWPMIFGMLGMVVYNLTDTYFIGKLGVAPLAAMGFTFPAVMFISSIVRGIGIGTASLFSRVIVAKDTSTVQRYSMQIFIFALTLTIFFVGTGQLTIQPLFQLLGASSDVIPLIREYMVIWYWGIIFLVIPMVGNNMIRATGNTFAPGMIMVFGSIMNLIFDPLLIFGWGPVPALGLQGAAFATVMSRALTLVLSLYVLIYRERLLAISRSSLREMVRTWGKALHASAIFSLGLGLFFLLVAQFFSAQIAAVFSTNAQVIQITSNYLQIVSFSYGLQGS